ncbi:MAG: MBL fold metallo-hydrolase [Firmicutes bacterium]|nr:MBL fold metallo-hydrolase [Bacillota bacterium]
MYREILPNLYLIEIPLPKTPLKVLNSYLLKGPERNLLIDTGLNLRECAETMDSALRQLDVRLDQTDLFITHMHADHSGLVAHLAHSTSKIYCSQPDAEIIFNDILSEQGWEKVFVGALDHGFPAEELALIPESHPGYQYAPPKEVKFTEVRDGDPVSNGDYHFVCMATPGHTRGHMCLYEADKKLLISGDHILDDITPNISSFDLEGWDPLGEYLAHLDQVYRMDVELTLPGHRRLIHDVRKRIDQLKQHHQERIDEIMTVVRRGSAANAYQIASQVKWDINCKSWDDFPLAQKWFATGEVVAHLRYVQGQQG